MLTKLIETEIKRLKAFKDSGYERDNETIDSYVDHFKEIVETIKKQLPSDLITLADMNTWCEVLESVENVMRSLGYVVNDDQSTFDDYEWVFQKQPMK